MSSSRDNVRCWSLDRVADDVSPFFIVPGCANVTSMVLKTGYLFTAVGDRGWGPPDASTLSPLMYYEQRAW